jgi:hypothetical protein
MSKMEKITSHQVLDLMEAYQSVYVPQEDLNEELIWEEVEFWVNSLVEEGYDLSEYSWEEMYESYLEEQGGRRGSGSNPSQTNQSVSGSQIGSAMRSVGNVLAYGNAQGTRPTTQSKQTNVRGGGTNPPPSSTAKPAPTSGNYQSRFAGSRDAAFKRVQGIKGSPVVGPRPSAAAPAARPAAGAPARPAAAPTRPAATAPATPKPAATTTPTPAPAPSTSPSRPSLSSQADEIRQMRARSLQRQGKTLDAATVSGTTRPAYQANSFDVFDVIKGHLIDEGYADTEEAALVIMANMSEEWREEILEGKTDRPLGYMHSFARGIKQKKGKKDAEHGQDTEGNPTGKYTQMLKKA